MEDGRKVPNGHIRELVVLYDYYSTIFRICKNKLLIF